MDDKETLSSKAKLSAEKRANCQYCGQSVRPVNLERHQAAHFKLKYSRSTGFNAAAVLPFYQQLLAEKREELTRLSNEFSAFHDIVKWLEDHGKLTQCGEGGDGLNG